MNFLKLLLSRLCVVNRGWSAIYGNPDLSKDWQARGKVNMSYNTKLGTGPIEDHQYTIIFYEAKTSEDRFFEVVGRQSEIEWFESQDRYHQAQLWIRTGIQPEDYVDLLHEVLSKS